MNRSTMSAEQSERYQARRVTRPGILIVDDDQAVRNALNCILQRDGFSVWTAAGPSADGNPKA